MSLDVGSIFSRIGARFDPSGFDEFDRRSRRTREESRRPIEAPLGARVDASEFREYQRHLDRVRAETARRDAFQAHLGADFDDRAFREFERASAQARREAASVERAQAGASASVAHSSRSVRGSMVSMGAGIVTGVGAITAGTAAAGAGALYLVNQWNESNKVAKQTEAVLKSTGGVANVTATQVGNLATEISKKTGIDDEAIQSGENLLLTFTNVRNEVGKGNDIFNQATQAAADMSVVFHQDLNASSIQLGKALDNPIKGVTALQRVGVSFTQAEKDKIKTLVESGKTLEAQKLILAGLNKQVAGSAEAGRTDLDALKVSAGNLAETVGGKLSPAINSGARFLTKFLDSLAENDGKLNGFRSGARSVAGVVGGAFSGAFRVGQRVLRTFGEFVAENRGKIDDFLDGLRDFGRLGVSLVTRVGKAFRSVFGDGGGLGSDIKQIAGTLVAFASTILNKVVNPIVRRMLPGIETAFRGLFTVIRGVVRIISGVLTGDFGKAIKGVGDLFKGGVKLIGGILRAGTAPIRAAAAAVGKAVWSVLEDGWRQAEIGARKFVNTIIDVLNLIPGVDIKHVSWGSSGSSPKSSPYQDGAAVNKNRQVKGYARGGRSEAGGIVDRPVVIMGEEAPTHPEWVIPTNPAYRDRAIGLWMQTARDLGIPGFAKGGLTGALSSAASTALDVATAPARGALDVLGKGAEWFIDKLPKPPGGFLGDALGAVKDKAVQFIKDTIGEFLPGGGTGDGVRTGTLALAQRIAELFGLRISSTYRDPGHNASVGGVPGSLHTHGSTTNPGATDLVGSLSAMRRASAYAARFGPIENLIHDVGSGLHLHLGWFAQGGQAFGVDLPGRGPRGTTPGEVKREVDRRRKKAGYRYSSPMEAARDIGTIGDFDPVEELRSIYREEIRARREKAAKGTQTAGSSPRSGTNRSLGRSMMLAAGWPSSEWPSLRDLWQGESGWNERARNPSSGAYGIPQSLPATKMASAGSDWMTNARTQIKWGLGYIKGRYGSPSRALSAWRSRSPHWYAMGGRIAGAIGFARGGKATFKPGRSRAVKKGDSLRSPNPGVERSVARAEKGIASYERAIQSLERDYEQTDREFGVMPVELVTENADGSSTVNTEAVNKRLGQVDTLIKKREAIKAKIAEYRAAIQRLAAELKDAIARLNAAIKATPGKSRAKVRDGYREARDNYAERLKEVGGVWEDLGGDMRDADIDLAELRQERATVAGTTGTAKPDDSVGGGDSSTSAAEIAAQAVEQFNAFQSSRASLLERFGSNVGTVGGPRFATDLAKAAGLSYYGAAETGPRTVVNLTNNYQGGPPNPNTYGEQQRYKLQGVI